MSSTITLSFPFYIFLDEKYLAVMQCYPTYGWRHNVGSPDNSSGSPVFVNMPREVKTGFETCHIFIVCIVVG